MASERFASSPLRPLVDKATEYGTGLLAVTDGVTQVPVTLSALLAAALPMATTVEMEGGTEVELRSMSPALVAAAIASLSPPPVLPDFGDIVTHDASEFDVSGAAAAITLSGLGGINRTQANGYYDALGAAAAISPITLGLVIGTNVQAQSSNLATWASTTPATERAAAVATAEAYADGLVLGLVDDRGNYNAGTNTWPVAGGSGAVGAILKGDLWTLSAVATAGDLLGFPAGCLIRAKQDTPGQTAANWAITEVGFGYAPENAANKATDIAGNSTSTTKYPSVKAVYDWSVGAFDAINAASSAQSAAALDATAKANARQAAITTGTTTQYFRGDLSLAEFPSSLTVVSSAPSPVVNGGEWVNSDTGIRYVGIGGAWVEQPTQTYTVYTMARRTASVGNIVYTGRATAGTAVDSIGWSLARLTISSLGVVTKATASDSWTNYLTATYI